MKRDETKLGNEAFDPKHGVIDKTRNFSRKPRDLHAISAFSRVVGGYERDVFHALRERQRSRMHFHRAN